LFVLCQPEAAALTCQLNPVLRRVCSYPSHSPHHARTHARTGGGSSRACVRACSQRQVSTMASDCVITTGGKHSAWSLLSASLAVSIFVDSTLTRRHAAFKFRGDTGPANVILSLSLAHAACCLVSVVQVRKTTSAQLQPCIAIVADWQAQRSLGGPLYTQDVGNNCTKLKIYFTLLWVWYTNKVRI